MFCDPGRGLRGLSPPILRIQYAEWSLDDGLRRARPSSSVLSLLDSPKGERATPFGQKRGSARPSAASRHRQFDLTRAIQDDGEEDSRLPATVSPRLCCRRAMWLTSPQPVSECSRRHDPFPHLHIDARARPERRLRRPRRLRPLPNPPSRPFPSVTTTTRGDAGRPLCPITAEEGRHVRL